MQLQPKASSSFMDSNRIISFGESKSRVSSGIDGFSSILGATIYFSLNLSAFFR